MCIFNRLIIEKLERNREKHPEIAIECCKSIIEGISKTIIITLNKSISEEDIVNDNFPKIYKKASESLAEYDKKFELEYVSSFNRLIKHIGEIRTHRGDIAHGKPVPKSQECSIVFSNSIINFTSTLLVYILEHYFSLEKVLEVIEYYTNEKFNKMLDESYIFPAICYSQALYEQDYETYLDELKNYQESLKKEGISSKEVYKAIIVEDKVDKTAVESSQKDEYIKLVKLNYKSKNVENILIQLCEEENLDILRVRLLLDNYMFDGRRPLTEDIVKVLNKKPKLLERKKVIPRLTRILMSFGDEYLM